MSVNERKARMHCPGFGDETNGMSVVAKLLASDPAWAGVRIVHGAWLVGTWLACLRFGTYVRMPHGAYDPVRRRYHGWKKRLVGPVERFFLRRATRVLATCAAEKAWILAYEPKAKVEIVDLKRYFNLEAKGRGEGERRTVHLLYLGRRHPLKGVEYLERAVAEMGDERISLKIVSDATGEEKERTWDWCDVLVLPTLSENFGLVVAEALARGKRVITTDGAPAWETEDRLTYLRGYRDGDEAERVRLLKTAIADLMAAEGSFFDFAAGVLGVPAARLTFETMYGAIPEWDSMAQLRLVMEAAAKYGVEIPFAEVTSLTSLWEFYRRLNGLSPKKVVAVDLDGVLWDGVIGEDGVDGIRPRTAFLRELKALKERGVILVALSKNDEEEGLRGLRGLRGLGVDDFVAWRINWACKAENLVQIAGELNLGLDAFVFVDDNPAERMEMKLRLPDVTVAEFPPKLAAYFPAREVTEEDRRKTDEYRAEAQRSSLRQKLRLGGEDVSEKLFAALDIRLDLHELEEGEVPRVAQLSQKANQFNVRTNRYTEDEVRRLGRDGLVVTVRSRDRFGDQGLVAYVIAKIADGEAEILDWVMSCRTMGRGIENRVEAEVERLLGARGVKAVRASWADSGRNAPTKDLFDRLGFSLVERVASCAFYRKDL